MNLKFGSFCSGIGAPDLAWSQLGWEPQFFSEIEPFPCAVLNHHFPHVPNLGDMEKIDAQTLRQFAVDVVVAGTPCQSFSVAGLRGGMADPRGNLALVFLRLADWLRPDWLVWENVPGVLLSNGGRDFGSFLGALGQLGYGWAYRILDAQYFGLPQRRRRVFVVGSFGDWRRASAVLFERQSLSGNPAPRRESGARIAASLTRGADSGGRGGYAGRRREDDENIIASCLDRNAGGVDDNSAQANHLLPIGLPDTCPAIKSRDYKGPSSDGDGDGAILIPIAFSNRGNETDAFETVRSGSHGAVPMVAFDTTQITSGKNYSNPQVGDPCHPLAAKAHAPAIASYQGVRRLMPIEEERLQGFPDNYTAIELNGKPAADSPRYRAIGNSMAVPVLEWIGRRIEMVEQACAGKGAA